MEWVLLIGLGLALMGLVWMYWHSYLPLRAIGRWAYRLRGGELSARVPVPKQGRFSDVATDLNMLAEMIQTLSRDTEEQLQQFTEHTAIRERTRMAGELHDSLAQTVASLKMQTRVLDESLHQGDEEQVWIELERIEQSLEDANTELRELIAHFRAPMHEAGLVPAIEGAVERFRCECPTVRAFLQTRWENLSIPSEHEFQVVRIVQEALANVRKHSQASTVRILVAGDGDSHRCQVLIEDDGIGFNRSGQKIKDDTHIGLSLLQDRARQMGASLQVESEAGEGVRVLLEFKAQPEAVAA